MRRRRWLLAGALIFLALLVATAGPARAEDLYIRNCLVQDAVVRGGERFVPLEAMEKYLPAAAIERIQVDTASGVIQVDGKPLAATLLAGDPARFPLVAVAEALGFVRRPNPALGAVDLLSPTALQEKKRVPQTHEGGRDYQVAKAAMARVVATSGLSSDEKAAARVTRIGNDLVAASKMPSLIWKFYVLEDEDPNAATTGPGFVYVTRGLLALDLSDDELAGILAHEVCHGTNYCRPRSVAPRLPRSVAACS